MNSKFFAFVLMMLISNIDALAQNGSWKRLLDDPVYGFSFNPKNPSTIIVGGLGRTLYKTFDAGKTWHIDSIEFRSGSSQLTNILISSIDTNIVLAGGVFNSIRRSTNQGVDWETVFEPEKPQFISPGETIIEHPENPNIIYAGDNNSNRIFRSTDIGKSWDTLATLNVPSLCTIAFRPDNPAIMFAGCKTGIIEKSIDSGKTWIRKATLRGFTDSEIPKIVFSKKNPMIGFAIIAYFLPDRKPNGGIFKTTDGGENWSEFGLRDTSFWALCLTEMQGNEMLFAGGYSDVSENIPGPGMIIQSDLQANSIVRYTSEIPWYLGTQNDPRRKNVWMMKASGNNQNSLFVASEAGFYVWEQQSTEVRESYQTIQYLRIGKNEIVVDNPELIHAIKISTIHGALIYDAKFMHSQQIENLSDGMYLILCTLNNGLSSSILFTKCNNELFVNHQLSSEQ